MRKLLIIMILLCHGLIAHTQQYFNNRYTLHSTNSAMTSIIPIGNKYYCTSVAKDSSYLGNFGIHFTILDSNGGIKRDTIFIMPYRNISPWNNSLTQLSGMQFLLANATDIDTGNVQRCLLTKFDTTGNVVWDTEYTKSACPSFGFWYIEDMKPTGTGEWLVLSHIACYDAAAATHAQEDMQLTKLDSHFNIEWNKEFGDPHWDDIGKKMVIIPGGYIISGVRNNLNLVGVGLKYRAEIIKTDTAGTVLWTWQSDPTKETGTVYDVLHTKDGGYIYCGMGNGKEDTVGSMGMMHWKGWVEKLDSNRNRVWYDTLDNVYNNGAPLVKIIELTDSSTIVGGVLGGGFDEDPINYALAYACMIKYKPNGEKIWQRKYTFQNDSLDASIYDMKQTPDGGFVICGESDDNYHLYGSPIQKAWVIKVDGNGCMSLTDTQCNNLKVVTYSEPAIVVHVYPNPVHHVLNIETSQSLSNGVLSIVDVAGRVLLTNKLLNRKETIDISLLQRGLYLYHITDNGLMIKTGKLEKW